jgi:hypothetical protein
VKVLAEAYSSAPSTKSVPPEHHQRTLEKISPVLNHSWSELVPLVARGAAHAHDGASRTASQQRCTSARVSRLGARPAPDGCGDGQVRCLNPVFWAVDTVVPLVTLGQRSTWYPPQPRRGVGNRRGHLAQHRDALGWVRSSIFLLSFTRLARSA